MARMGLGVKNRNFTAKGSKANTHPALHNLTHLTKRANMAAAFHWAAQLSMHKGVANHFSLAVNDDGTQFLINPFARHFARIKA